LPCLTLSLKRRVLRHGVFVSLQTASTGTRHNVRWIPAE
jgi:hypothetical protein